MISSVESAEGILELYFAWTCDGIEAHMNKWRETIVVDALCHTPVNLNISDLATRGLAKDEEVDIGSELQEGPNYLKYEREEWSILRKFKNKLPKEEVTKIFQINIVKTLPVTATVFDKIRKFIRGHGKLRNC